jgi:hypothetical protein
MTAAPSLRRAGFALLFAAAAAAAVLALLDARPPKARAAGEGAAGASGPARVAASVCEAQELKALARERADVRVEIPPEYDKPYPSLEACRSHEAAWDPDAPGPLQPIPFSHAHHAGRYEITCEYCHSGTDRSQAAGVPSVAICMGCHSQFLPDFDQLEGIRILKQHWEEQRPIEWIQIYRMPEHVQFRHNRHVAAGLTCQRCHGLVEQMDKLYLVADTVWWPYGLPANTLQMGWCITCHRESQVSQDCLTCHY